MLPAASWSYHERFAIWIAANALWTVTVAWVAFQIQQDGIAPAVLFPAAVGGLLGAGGLAITRFTPVHTTRVTLAAAVVWGLLVVVGQDYIGHRYRLRDYNVALGRHVPSLAEDLMHDDPLHPTFTKYLASRVSTEPVWWAIDLACTAGATVLVTGLGARRMRLASSREA